MIPIKPCDILLPREGTDLYRYACIACDQFTGDPAYWQRVQETVGDCMSTYNMTFAEIYLGKDEENKTLAINEAMKRYLAEDRFRTVANAVIYVERTLCDGRVRQGVVLAVDLDAYSYAKGITSPIRPTEGTIEDRLPPRVRIRKNAPLEFPHIMLLVDDPEKTLIEPLRDADKTLLYDTPLMENGGRVKGYRLSEKVQASLMERFTSREGKSGIFLAVGDGNHSLATAKKCWEELKPTLSEEEKQTHPAKYALCEIVNLHTPALDFEPIHRVVFHAPALMRELEAHSVQGGHPARVIFNGKQITVCLPPTHYLPVGTWQNFLDGFLQSHRDARIDYIHEPEAVEKLAREEGTVGILLGAMQKKDLFPAVEQNGALPRKTFSMGMGCDKRYYMEARKIRR